MPDRKQNAPERSAPTRSDPRRSDSKWHELEELLFALGADAVRIQERLAAADAARREQFVALLATAPPSLRSLLIPLAPARQVVMQHSVQCALRVTATRKAGFSLSVAPIRAGYSSLCETTASEQATVSIEIRAAPTAEPTLPES